MSVVVIELVVESEVQEHRGRACAAIRDSRRSGLYILRHKQAFWHDFTALENSLSYSPSYPQRNAVKA